MSKWAWGLMLSLSSVWLAGGASAAEEAFPAIASYIQPYQDAGAFDGVVLIARADEVVYRQAFGKANYELDVPMATSQRFRIASLSKQITQALIGRLVDRGLLELDAPVADVLSGFSHGDRITVAQLIEHTAGVPHTNRLEWMDTTKTLLPAEILSQLSAMPLDFEPGSARRYSNGGYAVLASLIEAVSGRPYAEQLRRELGDYPSIGHESPFEVVPGLASRYAPGVRYGSRRRATTYHVWNRIGGGSLYGSADDIFRLFYAAYRGSLVSAATQSRLFPLPERPVLVTGRSPGALAQIWFDPAQDLTVLTLSSNSAWPASFTEDLARLYVGEGIDLIPLVLAEAPDPAAAEERAGTYEGVQFPWRIELSTTPAGQLVWRHEELRTALTATAAGAWYLPVYDWLCSFATTQRMTCRQRAASSDARFSFERREGAAPP